ncbi:MAG: branched-chain amino acid ABC transporter permease [Planctomycetota bacterium]
MRNLPPWLRIVIVAVGLTAVAFPIVSIEGDGTGATITTRSLWFLAVLLTAGFLLYGLKLLRVVALEPTREVRERTVLFLRSPRTALVLVSLIMAIAVLFPFLGSRQMVNLGFETLIYMTLALGLNVVVGYAGLLVLGYAAFWAIGAYTFAILALRLDVSMWLALPISGLTSMLAGFLLGLPSLRLRGDYLAIVTLGFGEVVYYFLKTEVQLTGGEMGLPNKDIPGSLQDLSALPFTGPLIEPRHYYWPALALVILAVVVIRGVERSRVGRALVAMREDEIAARCMGINTTRLKLAAFAFSAMWAGFAGVLWTAKLDYTNPMYYYFMQSAMILAMVVLGGMGSIPGVMVGAALLYAGPALLRQYLPEFQSYRLLIFGALMVLLMIYRPQGLFGSARLVAGSPKEGES